VLTRRRAFWFVSLAFGAAGILFVAQSFVSISNAVGTDTGSKRYL